MSRDDPWSQLRQHTSARIALGRAGGSVPTKELLAFQLAHARARDAVHHDVDFVGLAADLSAVSKSSVVQVHSAATDLQSYLLRPDLGRRLAPAARAHVAELVSDPPADVALIIGDGLSGLAVERYAQPLLKAFVSSIEPLAWRLSPVILVKHARVAIQDEIGELLGARLSLMLLGERPGLGVPDSLAAYFTWAPRVGRNDAERNCVSNIRGTGLPPEAAAQRIGYLLRAAFQRQLTGVKLKDDSDAETLGERMAPGLPPSTG